MKIAFNHIALRCKDINEIVTFFIEVIGLEKGFRPPFSFDGFWLYAPDDKENAIIHIFGASTTFTGFSSKGSTGNGLFDHIAFMRDDYSSFIKHISKLKINFNETFVPSSNTKQVFIKGPEDMVVEIDFILKETTAQ